jgi:hypothetical protein
MRCRKITLAGVAVLLSLASGTAFAYFTTSGAGAASASTGTMLTVTLAATAGTPSTPLYPGGTGDVTLRVTNPNGYVVTLVSVAGTGGTITASNGCSPTGVTFTDQAGLNIPIAASGTTQVDLPGAAAMDATSANACQGATFSIPVTITVRK